MKQLGWILPGALLGFVLGGLSPRRELADLDEQLSRLRDELVRARSKASKCGRSVLSPIPGFPSLGGSEEDASEEGPAEDAPIEDLEPADPGAGDGAASPDVPPENALEQFDLAVAAQRLRAEQTRAALAEQADLEDEELERVDEIAAEMNQRLAEYADELVDIALSGEEPSPRETLGLTHDVTGILYESQVALDELVGPERIDDVDQEALVVWNYLDLGGMRGAVEAVTEANGNPPAGGPPR